MKALLKKIIEINEKYWAMAFQDFTEYNNKYAEYMASIEQAIHKYTKSNCDCLVKTPAVTYYEHPSTSKDVCNHCGRAQK